MALSSVMQAEADAIRSLRNAFPNEGPKKLANRINEGGVAFATDEHKNLVSQISGRPLLSIYSVIRRHDANKTVTGVKGKKLATA